LDKVDFSLRESEVHVLMGENGAGKSTLLKILSGAYPKDSGEIYLDKQKTEIDGPIGAQNLGISIIYQELNLIENMSVMENLYLGKMKSKNTLNLFIDSKVMLEGSKKILKELGLTINPKTKVDKLNIADQQMVEIAKALLGDPRIIIMDEPTSSLTNQEIKRLFEVINNLKNKGKCIIYISHRMEELWEIGDRITVLREGEKILTEKLKNIDEKGITRAMVGRDLKEKFPPKRKNEYGEILLKVENINRGDVLKNISLDVKSGEILGISGLVGAGRTELAKAIFGYDKIDSGRIYIDNKEVKISHPFEAIQHGIALIPEDRKSEGLVLDMSVSDNISLSILNRVTKMGVLSKRKEKDITQRYVSRLKVKTPNMAFKTNFLSGGNQQKVVLAKWLCAQANIFIFDEPTRGIDVGAKVEVYELMRELTEKGAAIIMISSEMPEILGLSDRILVMYNGEISGSMNKNEATPEKILSYAMGRNISEVSVYR